MGILLTSGNIKALSANLRQGVLQDLIKDTGGVTMNYWIGLIGMWIFSDSIYSLMLYLSAPGYNVKNQTWARDHWVRAVRAVCGLALIVMGAIS